MASRDGRTGPDTPPETHEERPPAGFSRRSFLVGASGGALAGAFAGGLAGTAAAATPPAAAPAQEGPETLSGTVEVTLQVNGRPLTARVLPQTTLLGALRHHVDPPLTGSKEVCDRGTCGACTVIVDGRPVYSCMQLAVQMTGREIRTVEGLGTPEAMSPVQAAFCEHDALMCGFCTPGFVVASTACLEKHGDPDLDTIKKELSGNVCRCGTYPHVFDAVRAAAQARGGRTGR